MMGHRPCKHVTKFNPEAPMDMLLITEAVRTSAPAHPHSSEEVCHLTAIACSATCGCAGSVASCIVVRTGRCAVRHPAAPRTRLPQRPRPGHTRSGHT